MPVSPRAGQPADREFEPDRRIEGSRLAHQR